MQAKRQTAKCATMTVMKRCVSLLCVVFLLHFGESETLAILHLGPTQDSTEGSGSGHEQELPVYVVQETKGIRRNKRGEWCVVTKWKGYKDTTLEPLKNFVDHEECEFCFDLSVFTSASTQHCLCLSFQLFFDWQRQKIVSEGGGERERTQPEAKD